MIIDNEIILIIAFILFIIGTFIAWRTDTTWLFMISGLLWFVPLFIVDNIFIAIFSISMILFWSIQAFGKKEEE